MAIVDRRSTTRIGAQYQKDRISCTSALRSVGLALIVWFTYYLLTRFSIASIYWLVGAFYGSLLLQLLLATHLYRITAAPEP